MIKKIALSLCFFLLATPVFAITAWEILLEKSSLTFTAIQNGSPVSGQFKSFRGKILFDPNELNHSEVNIVIDVGSVSTSYTEVEDNLKTADWFNVKVFPQAVFKSNDFKNTGQNKYQAKGMLTLRDKSVPVTLDFVQKEYTPKQAHMVGSTLIKRSVFGVGQGEWASTDEIKDEVKINFDVIAVKKS